MPINDKIPKDLSKDEIDEDKDNFIQTGIILRGPAYACAPFFFRSTHLEHEDGVSGGGVRVDLGDAGAVDEGDGGTLGDFLFLRGNAGNLREMFHRGKTPF